MVIPYDVPVILQFVRTQTNLQNPPGSRKARCYVDYRDVYEQMLLHSVGEKKVTIQAVDSARYLQVSARGICVFDPSNGGSWERFVMESDSDGYLHFISCHLGTILKCKENGVVECTGKNLYNWTAWRIVEPRATISTVRSAGKERQDFILELAKCGKTPAEIDLIVTRMFDAILPSNQFSTKPEKSEGN
ncbi:hypothetical protein PHMEG_0005516 [Phytophthora megakarya]|uniref:Uncharacterized protein n=1 Tax=Phytophthora megakarya TaxID=4795 RepID=A0A225WSM2_9STRA|nr:hypothetical protein PHMEG_0005516 [Phytophthora megakarya]